MLSEDRPKVEQCDRYCPKHPMSRCGGRLNHRGYHQCHDCELEGIETGNMDDISYHQRYFEYR